MNKKTKRLIQILNHKGVSMVEVMVVAAIMGFIGIGVASLMTNLFSIQKRGDMKASLEKLRTEFRGVLSDDAAWDRTINDTSNNAIMDCLRDTTPHCTDGPKTANFRIFNADGSEFYRADQGTQGFTFNGQPCNSFNGAGNDNCPFRYDIEWSTQCPTSSGGSCPSPQVSIAVNLRLAPENPGSINERLDVNQYSFVIRRPMTMLNEMLIVEDRRDGNAEACPLTNDWWTARINTEAYDSGNNVTINAPTRRFRLQAGRYLCHVKAQGYDLRNGFRVGLLNVSSGTRQLIGNGYTSNQHVVTVVGSVIINITAATNFEIQYYCRAGGGGAERAGYDVGTQNVYRSVTCTRLM